MNLWEKYKDQTNGFKLTVIFVVVVIIVLPILNIQYRYEYLHSQFNGIVDSISYGDKGTPIIRVKKKEYYLYSDEWAHLVEKGDSIVKQSNSTIITLVKPNGKILIRGGK